jgi:hypothetical protein
LGLAAALYIDIACSQIDLSLMRHSAQDAGSVLYFRAV